MPIDWPVLLKRLLKWGIALLVVCGLGHKAWTEKQRLAHYELDLEPWTLVLAAISYAAGLSLCGLFWWAAMRDCGARPTMGRTMLAYFAGHLAKYVPGKGLVVVVRAMSVQGPGVTIPIAAVACLHETVLMMATGAFTAFLLLVLLPLLSPRPEGIARAYLLWSTILLAALLGVFAVPAVIRYVGRMALRPFPGAAAWEVRACRNRTVLLGVLLTACGWWLMGLSFGQVLRGMGLEPREPAIELLTMAVALATVGGFAALTPGGLGAREWILVELLGPAIGSHHVLVAAVLLRLVWIGAEMAATVVLWLLAHARRYA